MGFAEEGLAAATTSATSATAVAQAKEGAQKGVNDSIRASKDEWAEEERNERLGREKKPGVGRQDDDKRDSVDGANDWTSSSGKK